MDIVAVLVDAVPEDLLALLVNEVNVVKHHELLLVFHSASGLAKGLDIGSIVVDALLFETVDVENVLRMQFPTVVFADNCAEKGGFAGGHVPCQQDIQVVHLDECFNKGMHIIIHSEIIKVNRLKFMNK